MENKARILLVEDDTDLSFIVVRAFENEGFETTAVTSAEDAYDVLTSHTFDALVLDVNLPSNDGFELCRTLRRTSGVPVVFASARSGENVRAIALEGGGDAYLPKPYSLRELIAQVNALLRRTKAPVGANIADAQHYPIALGEFAVDPAKREISKGGKHLQLSPKEFDLAWYLMRNAETIISKDKLLAEVWGAFCEIEPQTVAVHISWLRNKMEDDPAHPKYLKTVRGCGYMFQVPACH